MTRSKVQGIGTVSNSQDLTNPCTDNPHIRFALIESLAAMVNNFAGAVAFQKIGWKYMLVPAVWDVVETIVVWLCAVETKGRTLYVALCFECVTLLMLNAGRNWMRFSRFGWFVFVAVR